MTNGSVLLIIYQAYTKKFVLLEARQTPKSINSLTKLQKKKRNKTQYKKIRTKYRKLQGTYNLHIHGIHTKPHNVTNYAGQLSNCSKKYIDLYLMISGFTVSKNEGIGTDLSFNVAQGLL